eukprot:3118576-Rhodomonas_salina.1
MLSRHPCALCGCCLVCVHCCLRRMSEPKESGGCRGSGKVNDAALVVCVPLLLHLLPAPLSTQHPPRPASLAARKHASGPGNGSGSGREGSVVKRERAGVGGTERGRASPAQREVLLYNLQSVTCSVARLRLPAVSAAPLSNTAHPSIRTCASQAGQ